jgi:hypothetical protein
VGSPGSTAHGEARTPCQGLGTEERVVKSNTFDFIISLPLAEHYCQAGSVLDVTTVSAPQPWEVGT